MTDIYFIRHCESVTNAMGIFAGNSEYPISERGEEQLKYLKERFKKIHLDKVYTSPLSRAYKTGEAVNFYNQAPLIVEPDLHERSMGIYEGLNSSAYTPEEQEYRKAHPMDFRPPKGENVRDVIDRVMPVLRKIIAENPGKTVAVTAHGGVIKYCFHQLRGLSDDEIRKIKIMGNTGVTLVRFSDPEHFVFLYENDTSHLPPELDTQWKL